MNSVKELSAEADNQTSNINRTPQKLQCTDRFTVCHSRIMHQTIELETLILNIDTGIYYSAERSASLIWLCLISGKSLKETSSIFGEYGVTAPTLEDDISNFIQELLFEGLIIRSDSSLSSNQKDLLTDHPHAGKFEASYRTPSLTRYTDLQQMLLADPIHELVDER